MLGSAPAWVSDGYVWAGFAAAVLTIVAMVKRTWVANILRDSRRAFVGWLMADTVLASKEVVDAGDEALRVDLGQLSAVVEAVKGEVSTLKQGQTTIHRTQAEMQGTLAEIRDALVGREPTPFDPTPPMGLISKVDRLFANGENTDDPGDLLKKIARSTGVLEEQKADED